WQADFSGQYDLQPGAYGEVRIQTADNLSTIEYWQVLDTEMFVYSQENQIVGYDWESNEEVEVFVNDQPVTHSVTQTDDSGYFNTMLDAVLQTGDTVKVNVGSMESTLEVESLIITNVDYDTGVVGGESAPQKEVEVQLLQPSEGNGLPTILSQQVIEADSNGDWIIDFDQTIADGVEIVATISDGQGNGTRDLWVVKSVGSVQMEVLSNGIELNKDEKSPDDAIDPEKSIENTDEELILNEGESSDKTEDEMELEEETDEGIAEETVPIEETAP
ncbi:MAG TPA: hypothetical protein DHN33_00045, partial [Eubacteriaceae bacterium]|nr:hypothetical protein [Eubacteriaceae bacterium]